MKINIRFYIYYTILLCSILSTQNALATLPEEYLQLFHKRASDNRSLMEKALNAIGLSRQEVGHSVAIVAHVSKYPNLSPGKQLPQARIDSNLLVEFLTNRDIFDDVIKLSNEDFNYNTLHYFLSEYIPEQLKGRPKTRFLFFFSGHGFIDDDKLGHLLTSKAKNLKDKTNAIPASILRTYLLNATNNVYNALVLINACNAGAFNKLNQFGTQTYLTGPGAHVILSAGPSEKSWAVNGSNAGSVFGTTLIEGLSQGKADIMPAEGDGVISANELILYMQPRVKNLTDGVQTPRMHQLRIKAGDSGSFFFLSRKRKVTPSYFKKQNPSDPKRPMGESRSKKSQSKPKQPKKRTKRKPTTAQLFKGLWSGTYRCADMFGIGKTNFRFDVKNGALTKVTENFRRSVMLGGTNEYDVVSVTNKKIILQTTYLGGYKVEFRFSENNKKLIGRYIGHLNCQTIQLSRQQ